MNKNDLNGRQMFNINKLLETNTFNRGTLINIKFY